MVNFEHMLEFWSVLIVDFEHVFIAYSKNSLHRTKHCSLKKLSQEIFDKSFENNFEGAHFYYSFRLEVHSFTAN